MSKIKVGIIGVGGIAKLHVPGWRMSEHAELIAGSDINNSILEFINKEGSDNFHPASHYNKFNIVIN